MSRLFLPIIVILGLLASCGLKTSSPTTKSTSAPSFITLTEVNCTSDEENAVHVRSVEFAARVETFINHYNQLTSSQTKKLPSLYSASSKLFLDSTPLDPLIISEVRLERTQSLLEAGFRKLIGPSNDDYFKGAENSLLLLTAFSPSQYESFEVFLKRTRKLLAKGYRWQSLQCSLDELSHRKDRDVRRYFSLLEVKEEKGEGHPLVSEAAMDLCGEFHSPVICLSEHQILRRKNLESKFTDLYQNKGREKRAAFFQRHSDESFSCKEEQGVTILEIPFVSNQALSLKLGGNFLELNKGVTKRWSNAKFKVVLKKVTKKGPGVLSFIWQKGGISFVDRADPFTINLSEHLVNQQLILTIAHEIGQWD